MTHEQVKRRYFIGEGAQVDTLRDEVLRLLSEQKKQRADLQNKYGADAASIYRDGRPFALAFLTNDGDTSEIPQGFRLERTERAE